MRSGSRTVLNRRQLLKTIGAAGAAAAGGALLPRLALAGEAAPAAPDVADKASAIRIADLQPIISAGRVYVKLTTNFGVTGWGEIKGVEPQTAAALAASMAAMLRGENPTRIEHLWQRLFRAHRNQRGGPFMVHAISGIDMALWDVAGKLWQTPVYRLLGGPTRDRIRVYPTARAVKLAAGGAHEFSSGPKEIDALVASVKRAREQVGPGGAVMFDAHGMLPPATLIQFAAAIQPADLLFLEEPWVPGNIEVCKKIRAAVKVPLATGERDRTMWGMLPYLQEQVIDVVQPDVGYGGGISQMRKVAAIAEAYFVPLAPHNTQSYLGLTASLHVAASVPLFLIHEAYDDDTLGKAVQRRWSVDADGYASLPDGTGLCVDVDEAALAQLAADPKYKFTWPDNRLKDGSVADY